MLETIEAASIVWAAGVGANPITRTLGVDIDRAGRIKVNPDLSIPGYPEAFAIGDIAFILNKDGTPGPGRFARRDPDGAVRGQGRSRPTWPIPTCAPTSASPFKYWDKGTMATIGHSRAVAMIGRPEVQRLPRLAGLARRAHPLPRRLYQQAHGGDPLGLGLLHPPPGRARDHFR